MQMLIYDKINKEYSDVISLTRAITPPYVSHIILFLLYLLIYQNSSAKRRNANHPCPVCGKFYVNEGSLRKHLACHPEMANQLSSSLRMWPCTVCTAVFTHENGKNDYIKLIFNKSNPT